MDNPTSNSTASTTRLFLLVVIIILLILCVALFLYTRNLSQYLKETQDRVSLLEADDGDHDHPIDGDVTASLNALQAQIDQLGTDLTSTDGNVSTNTATNATQDTDISQLQTDLGDAEAVD